MSDDAEAANRFVSTLLEEVVGDRKALAGLLRRLSTARLQEVRRAVDAELAGRVQPSEDLRDVKAGRS